VDSNGVVQKPNDHLAGWVPGGNITQKTANNLCNTLCQPGGVLGGDNDGGAVCFNPSRSNPRGNMPVVNFKHNCPGVQGSGKLWVFISQAGRGDFNWLINLFESKIQYDLW